MGVAGRVLRSLTRARYPPSRQRTRVGVFVSRLALTFCNRGHPCGGSQLGAAQLGQRVEALIIYVKRQGGAAQRTLHLSRELWIARGFAARSYMIPLQVSSGVTRIARQHRSENNPGCNLPIRPRIDALAPLMTRWASILGGRCRSDQVDSLASTHRIQVP